MTANAAAPHDGALSWAEIDTVLLDMDGTLLDLHFDNHLWNTLLPERYAARHGLSLDAANEALFGHMKDILGTLQFYCLDYWSEHTGMDVVAMHHELTDRVIYRPGAERFLSALGERGIKRVLATNAHRDALTVKDNACGLAGHLDTLVSSHDYQQPKEAQAFWEALAAEHPFDPARTLFVDDNEAVLDAAVAFGVAHVLCPSQPDSQRPARTHLKHPALDHFDGLSDALVARSTP